MVPTFTVKFLPSDKTVTAPLGFTVMDAAHLAGVFIEAPCGGSGSCGACAVYLQRPDGTEQMVLSCQHPVTADLVVRVPVSNI